MEYRPNVLLVENNETEEMLARRAITNAEIGCHVRVAKDGEEACRMLFESGEPPPTLVLLELGIPKLNGYEVLTRIRRHKATKRLPVIVLSALSGQVDVNRCFDLHANSFVQKDENLEVHEARLKLVLYYWLAVNRNGNA